MNEYSSVLDCSRGLDPGNILVVEPAKVHEMDLIIGFLTPMKCLFISLTIENAALDGHCTTQATFPKQWQVHKSKRV